MSSTPSPEILETDTAAARLKQWILGPLLLGLTGSLLAVLALTPGYIPNPSLLELLVVVYTTFRCGTGPGMLTAALMFVFQLFYFAGPADGPYWLSDRNLRQLILLILVAPGMVLLVGRLRSRAEVLAAEAEQRRRTEAMESVRRVGERRLRVVADSLPVLIAFVGQDLRYQFNNANYRNWFGSDCEDLTGRHVRELIGEDAFREREHVLRAALNGIPQHLEIVVRHKDQGLRNLDAHYVPHMSENGKVDGLAILGLDVTDRHRNLRRQQYLAEVTERLTHPGETDEVLQRVVEAAVPRLCDWCSVYRLNENGSVFQVALAAPNAEMHALERIVEERWPGNSPHAKAVAMVLQLGRPHLVEQVDASLLPQIARDEEHLRALEAINIVSCLAVP